MEMSGNSLLGLLAIWVLFQGQGHGILVRLRHKPLDGQPLCCE